MASIKIPVEQQSVFPKTGRSSDTLQNIIIGLNTTCTYPLSTSVFMLYSKKGMILINRLEDIDAVIIDRDGNMMTVAKHPRYGTKEERLLQESRMPIIQQT